MKILFFTRQIDNVVGGLERQINSIVEELANRGHELVVISLDKRDVKSFYKNNSKNIRWIGLDVGDVSAVASNRIRIKRQIKLLKLIRQERPDIAVSFMIAAKILQKNKIRIIDFLGTVALARFPTLLITICIYLIRVFYPSTLEVDMSKGYPIHATLIQYLVSLIITTLVVWQAFTYFYAFKESSGLLGKKLLWGFLGVIILVQFIALPFTNSFMS